MSFKILKTNVGYGKQANNELIICRTKVYAVKRKNAGQGICIKKVQKPPSWVLKPGGKNE